MAKANNNQGINQRKNAAGNGAKRPTTRKASKTSKGTARATGRSAGTGTSKRQPTSRSKAASASSKTTRSNSRVQQNADNTRKLSKNGGVTARTSSAPSAKRSGSKSSSKYSGDGKLSRFINLVRTYPQFMLPLLVVFAVIIGYFAVDIGASWGKIHPGVRVQGVDVGGMTTEEASAKLTESLSPQLQEAHITLYENADVAAADGVVIESNSGVEKAYAEQTSGSDVNKDGVTDKWVVTAETIGAYVDGDALAQQAYRVGREGNIIAERFGAWFGGKYLDATVSVSDERFNTLMAEINSEIGKQIVDSTLMITGGIAKVVPGSDGRSVEQAQFITSFSHAAFNANKPFCTIPMQTDQMHISSDTAQRVADQVTSTISSDVSIVYNTNTWTMNPTDLGNVISTSVLQPDQMLVFGNGTQRIEPKNSSTPSPYDTSAGTDAHSNYVLQAYVDQGKMDEYLVGILGDAVMGGAQDASFDTSSGEVVIIESVEGNGPDRAAAEVAMQDMLFGTQTGTLSNRTITLVDTVVQPEFTTEKARSMGITELLATWSIPLSGTSDRIHNIQLLCELINNSLVAPGQEWSFNGTTGERTAEKGFGTAPVIINGKHEDQLGGGICQVATCVYNCACFSGLEIRERVNHDFYIASYDEDGFADATVSWEKPDLRFANDMSTYILITADASDEDVIISFWGTKDGRTVECQRGEWKDGEKYKVVQENDDTLPAGTTQIVQNGQDGKSIDIRYLCKSATGEVLHDVTFHSVYSAQNEIVSVGTAPTG